MDFDFSVIPRLEQRLEFIRNMDFPRAQRSGRVRRFAVGDDVRIYDDRAQSAMLIGGTLLGCMAGVSREEKKEINNSIKIASLMCDRYEDEALGLDAWLNLYARTLNHFGWYSDRHPGEKVYRDLSGTVSGKMIEAVRQLGNEPMLANTMAAFKALESDSRGLTTYAGATLYGKSFQIAPAGRDSKGILTVALNHARLNAKKETETFLFVSWMAGEAELRHNYRSFYLDRNAYAQTKQELEDILEASDMAEIELRL
ncbi:hypothetical protein [Pseudomonas sp. 18173]|uniref:hypothetical protein n=1 Tax=Pseudomonas sp. 18173 TaxID=3390055 RepID=UPI003D1E0DD8